MTSNDNENKDTIYIREDVFNARMDRLEAINEKNLALIQKENAEFREQIKEDMRNGFDKINAQIIVLQGDTEGLKHDVTGLYHWDYWLLSIILVLFAMPQIIAGVKSLFSAITDGIAGILTLFKRWVLANHETWLKSS